MTHQGTYFTSSPKAHIAAIAGAIVLHSSLAAWAMMPDPPMVIPQQQIIQVSMVAPSVVKQKPTPETVIERKKPAPPVPPKSMGMVKAEPKKEPVKQREEPKKSTPEPKKIVQRQTHTAMTSGIASPDATQKESAFVEPVAANYLNNPPPQYPIRARRRKEQGTVMLDVFVSTAGTSKWVAIGQSSGIDILDEAALEAVKQWKFVPARRGSEIVEAKVRVPVIFKLN